MALRPAPDPQESFLKRCGQAGAGPRGPQGQGQRPLVGGNAADAPSWEPNEPTPTEQEKHNPNTPITTTRRRREQAQQPTGAHPPSAVGRRDPSLETGRPARRVPLWPPAENRHRTGVLTPENRHSRVHTRTHTQRGACRVVLAGSVAPRLLPGAPGSAVHPPGALPPTEHRASRGRGRKAGNEVTHVASRTGRHS